MLAKLFVKDSVTGAALEHPITRDRVRIGREPQTNDLVLDSAEVSRYHAVLQRKDDGYRLVDLGSANGTFVNGQRIKEELLENSDIITISHYRLEFVQEAEGSSLWFAEGRLGGTVLLRRPEDIAARVPRLDQSATSAPGIERLAADNVAVLRKKAETLIHLYELNRMLGSVFSLEVIFKKVSEMLFRLTAADRFFVLLKSAGSDELSPFSAEFRDSRTAFEGKTYPISKTVLDRVLAERVSLLSIDAQADERFALAGSIIIQNVQSVICAPLLGRKGVLGAMYLDCQQAGKLFGEDDLDLVNALAAETSIAVDNALSHEQLVKEALARAAYCRFVPPHVVDEILVNPQRLQIGGCNQVVTTLFSDIRGFTSMAESMAPETVVGILNEYFAQMTPIVFQYSGLLDKLIGDGLMALFGVPYQRENAVADAVSAALAMQQRTVVLNRELKERRLPQIAIGIGIHTGNVTVGYIGSEQRTDYTAIGDSVNLAARLEKHAQAGQILISRATRDALGDRFSVRAFGEITFKGKRAPIEVFEVLATTDHEFP